MARNPSNFTFHGTNTYIIGHGNVAVIDPGPLIEEHLCALISALKDDTVEHILVTHTHNDHSPGVVPLKEKIGGQIWGAHPREIPSQQQTSESIDWNFSPDHVLRDGTQIASDEWTIETIATPQLSMGTMRCCSPLPRTSGVWSATPSMVGALGP